MPPAFTAGFSPIIKILNCDTFIHLMRMVLERAQAKYVRWYTDAHLDKVSAVVSVVAVMQITHKYIVPVLWPKLLLSSVTNL